MSAELRVRKSLAEGEGLELSSAEAQQFSGLRPCRLGLTLRKNVWQERSCLNPHKLLPNQPGYLYLTHPLIELDARGRI